MRGKAELAILRVKAFSNSGQGTKGDLALRVRGFRNVYTFRDQGPRRFGE